MQTQLPLHHPASNDTTIKVHLIRANGHVNVQLIIYNVIPTIRHAYHPATIETSSRADKQWQISITTNITTIIELLPVYDY